MEGLNTCSFAKVELNGTASATAPVRRRIPHARRKCQQDAVPTVGAYPPTQTAIRVFQQLSTRGVGGNGTAHGDPKGAGGTGEKSGRGMAQSFER
jgi:hypothetical protein